MTLLMTSREATLTAGPAMSSTSAVPGESPFNSKAITITVHPDVYAKLTDESNADWHALMASAAAKNITFATT